MNKQNPSNQTDENRDRRWWLALLLLLLFVCCGLFSSAQFAVSTGFDNEVAAQIKSNEQADYILPEGREADIVFRKLDPNIVSEATQDAKALKATPSPVLPVALVQIPSTRTPTPFPPTVTNTPRATFTTTPNTDANPTLTATPQKTLIATLPTPSSSPSPLPSPIPITPGPGTSTVSPGTPTPTQVGDTPATAVPATTQATDTPAIAPTATVQQPTSTPIVVGTSTPVSTPLPTAPPTPAPTTPPTSAPTTPPTPVPTATPIPVPTVTPTIAIVIGVEIIPDNTGQGTPGQTIVYNHTVRNTGNTIDTISLSASSSQGFGVSLSTASLILAPGGTAPLDVTVVIPTNAAGGTVDVTTVTATSGNDVTVSDSALDTTSVNTFRGVLVTPNRTGTANPGQVVTYTHFVSNTSNIVDTFNLSASSDQGFATSLSTTSVNLSPGTGTQIQVYITIPASAAGGLVDVTTVTAQSTTDGTVNDSAADTTTVNLLAGVIIAPDRNGTAQPGQEIVYSHLVTNTGNSVDSFTINVNSSQGLTVIANPTTISSLAVGASAPVNITIVVPVTSAGDFTDTTTVTAVSGNDAGVSDMAIDTTYVPAAPPASFILNAADGDQLVSLGWIIGTQPVTYEIRYSVNGGVWQNLTTIGGTTDRYYHVPATNGTTYYYQAIAHYAASTGYSNIASATPNTIAVRKPDCSSATLVDIDGVTSATCAQIDPTQDQIDAETDPNQTGVAIINTGGNLILDYGTNEGIVDGPDNDMAYFEWPVGPANGIELGYVTIDVSEDGSSWITIFNWDGVGGGAANTNISSYAVDGNGEVDHEFIPETVLLADLESGPPPAWPTGISIDISATAPAGIKYQFVRLTRASGTGQSQVDAIFRIK